MNIGILELQTSCMLRFFNSTWKIRAEGKCLDRMNLHKMFESNYSRCEKGFWRISSLKTMLEMNMPLVSLCYQINCNSDKSCRVFEIYQSYCKCSRCRTERNRVILREQKVISQISVTRDSETSTEYQRFCLLPSHLAQYQVYFFWFPFFCLYFGGFGGFFKYTNCYAKNLL